MMRSPVLAAAAAFTFFAPGLVAQDHDDSQAHHVQEIVSVLDFREIGPTIVGGRIADLAVNEADPRIFYVGTAHSGIWKTVNGGISFDPIFEDQMTSSIGDVTLAPSNPNVLWVGTGEPQNRQSSPWGNGVYRSVDAGRSFVHLGLEDTHHISRIQVHPADPDVAYVGAVGHLWGPNAERGVYRTTDGGATWEKVLFIDENTGVIDLIMDPHDPNTLFAATYQRQRRAWGFNGGGPGSGIWRTFDGGDTWEELTDGLPQGDMGRIGLDIYRQNSDWIYAVIEADPSGGFGGGGGGDRDTGVYRSWDRGETWEQVSTTNPRPMYYSQIRVDPNDAERVYLGGPDFYMSEDGGRTFTNEAAPEVHLDHHAIWIDPNDSDHMMLGSDGGVSVSRDRSEHWLQFTNLPIALFYEVGVGMERPYTVCGGLQDNGSWCTRTDTWSRQGIRTSDWFNIGGGDGFFTELHPNGRLAFAESQGGNLVRVDLLSNERQGGYRPNAFDENGEEINLRRNWNTPILMSSHSDSRMYYGANMLFRSDDLGISWTRISDELSYAIDRNQLEIMGVRGSEPQMSRNDGQSNYGNIVSIGESPVDENVLYTGADDGRLMGTRDGGATWTDLTDNVPGLPANTYVTRIIASHAAAGTVYAAFDGHRSDDYEAWLFRSDDYGANWRRITNGLPVTSLNALEQHPRNADLWFVGNEIGVYVSVDAGENWHRMAGLPTVPVDDIDIHPRDNDLVLGTHGRGIWIVEDITPLENLGSDGMMSDVQLFGVRDVVSFNTWGPQEWPAGVYQADNAEPGARFRFHIGHEVAEAAENYRLRVTDASGTTVRVLEGEAEPGVHEVIWNLALTMPGGDGEMMSPGPRVMPGTYRVTLEVDGVQPTAASTFDVLLDPRVDITPAQLTARHRAMIASYQLSGSASEANRALGQAEDRLDEAMERAEAAGDDALVARIRALMDERDDLDDALGDASDGAGAWRSIQSIHMPPTQSQLDSIERSWRDLPGVVRDINAWLAGDLSGVISAAAAADRPAPGPIAAVSIPTRGGGD